MNDSLQDRTVEIRLLGALSVRRADGSLVESKEWRTGKTADLLRLVALGGGRPVPIGVLLDRLWPEVPEERGRASLRTAASQIRRTIGSDCLERLPEGLRLNDAWVDAQAFRALAQEARTMAARQQHREVVALARDAVVLYAGDVTEESSAGQHWAADERAQLAIEHQELLESAAMSACSLGWYAEAVDFATAAIRRDPLAERAQRALMIAHHGLGDVGRALRCYEQLRQGLADELGADPSPQTQALHLEILSGSVRSVPAVRQLQPHPRHVDQLVGAVEETVTLGGRRLVTLRGASGAGRCEVVAAALGRLAADGWRVVAGIEDRDLDRAAATWERGDRTLVVFPRGKDRPELVDAALALPAARGTVVALVPRPELVDATDTVTSIARREARIDVEPLSREDTAAVVAAALGSPLGPVALDELMARTEGLLVRVDDQVRGWLAAGRLVATSAGMHLQDEGAVLRSSAAAAAVLHALSPADMDVAATLAVVQGPATASEVVAGIHGSERGDVGDTRRRLDLLVDRGVLALTAEGYEFREPHTRDAAERWLRPTRRRALRRQLAGCDRLSPESRARHWLSVGEPEEALAVVVAAAAEAEAAGHIDRAYHLFRYAVGLAAGQRATSARGLAVTTQAFSALLRLSVPTTDEAAKPRVVGGRPRPVFGPTLTPERDVATPVTA